MQKFVVILALLTLIGCSPSKEVVNVIKGNDGANGHSLVSSYNESTSCECGENGGSRLDIYLDMDDSLSATEGDLYQNSLVVCNGLNGLNGRDGEDGEQGIQGPQGEQGPRGIPGRRGPRGLQGAVGPQGLVGATGPQGAAGAIGPQGPQGVAGPTGPQGPQGPQGLQGTPGVAGSSGATIVTYTSSSCTHIAGSSYYVKPNGNNTKIYTSSSCSSSSSVEELGDGDSYWVGTNMLAVDYGDIGIKVITFN